MIHDLSMILFVRVVSGTNSFSTVTVLARTPFCPMFVCVYVASVMTIPVWLAVLPALEQQPPVSTGCET